MEEIIPNPDIEITLDEDENSFRHLNNPADGIKPIVKKYLGVPNNAVQAGNKFYFTDGEAKVEATVVTNEIIRIRLAPHGVFLDEFSYAVPELKIGNVECKLSEDTTE